MASLTHIAEEIRLAGRALGEFGAGLFNPTVRLGVTGLSGAGKTVFITALVHHLLHRGRLPVFEALASGRIARARLEPQPDDAVPRFDYETHLRALTEERRWPESTSRISELRLVIEYQSARSGRDRRLTLDIVDYPGEWLLDLPLLGTSYSQWSAETLRLSHLGPRAVLAARWHKHLATLNPDGPESEPAAFNAGPDAVKDLEGALAAILASFRTGRTTLASALFRPRIDRILFAATKADHLHHSSHDRLEGFLARMTERAIAQAKFSGATVDVVALAAVRATHEAMVARGREKLPAITGTPLAGESLGADSFSGEAEIAAFPGDLPDDPTTLFKSFTGLTKADETDYRFLRFRPPQCEAGRTGAPTLPHIRLDRA